MSDNKKLVTLDVMQEFNKKKTKNIFVTTDDSTAIQGNLIVSGSTITQDTETLAVKDNIIVANADGANLIENAGFVIKTNSTDAYGITYDPVGDGVKIGLGNLDENGKFNYTEGEDQFLATRSDAIVDGNIPQWDDAKKEFVDSGKSISDIVKEFSQIFYTEVTWEEVANGTYTSVPIGTFGNAYGMDVSYTEIQESIPAMLKVELDGATYNNLTLTETGEGEYAAGNLSKLNSLKGTSYEDTGEPFIIGIGGAGGCLVATDLTQSTTHDIKIYFFIENVTKIDKKYLYQPDWNQSDSTQPDYIKNRPFYEDNKVIASWNFDNLSSRDQFSLEGLPFYKISDDNQDLQTNFVEGAELEVFGYMEGTPTTEKLLVAKAPEIGCYVVIKDTQVPAVIYIFDKEKFLLPVPSNGLYVIYYAQDNTIVAGVQKILGCQIKKLDEKFLPDDILRTADKDELNSNIVSLENSMNGSMNFYDRKIQEHSNEISAINNTIEELVGAIEDAVEKLNEEKITIVEFNITADNTAISLDNLENMTQIDWGDGTINSELSHVYITAGKYTCKIYDATSIGEYAFQSCGGLTSVVIPNSVTSIGDSAFFKCSNLTSVVIPNSVTNIGDNAFYECSNLTELVIPSGLTSIKDMVFGQCSGLTNIVIPYSVISIGRGAFGNCHGLTNVVIPNSVITIGDWAFRDCYNLTSVVIPNSVTSIGDGAFYECSNLTSIEIPDSVTSIGDNTFYSCDKLTSVVIGDSVTSIGNDAFRNCSSLMSINIPDSVTSIGSNAFYNCSSLTNITVGSKVASIGNKALLSLSNLTSIIFKNLMPVINVMNFIDLMHYAPTHIYVPYDTSEIYKAQWGSEGVSESVLNLIVESDREATMSDLNNLVGDINSALEAILGV